MRSSTRGGSSSLLFVLTLWGAVLGTACSAGTIGDAPEDGTSDDDLVDDGDGETTGGSGGADAAGPGVGSGPGTSGVGVGGATAGPGGTGGATAGGGGDDTTSSSGDATSTGTGPTGPACGDGACDEGETCESCASDCGACNECAGASDATTGLDAEEEAFLVRINEYRAENGRGPLTACTSLNRAAQGHSEDMRDQNYFDHTGLNGSSPWERACDACYELGCGPSTAMAENIAAGNTGATGTFEQWRNSPGHNTNMLGASFTQIGIGRATGGGTYGTYWTNVFGGDSEPSCN